jgi:hypothetical protein
MCAGEVYTKFGIYIPTQGYLIAHMLFSQKKIDGILFALSFLRNIKPLKVGVDE